MFPHPELLWIKTHKQHYDLHGRQQHQKPIKKAQPRFKNIMLTLGTTLIKLGTSLQNRAVTQPQTAQIAKSLGETL